MTQIDWHKQKKAEDLLKSKLYYKPHYGPEESQETVAQMLKTQSEKIKWQYDAIKGQLNEQAEDAKARR